METTPEIEGKAKILLWVDRDEDYWEINKIITDCTKKGYDGRVLEEFKLSPDGQGEFRLNTQHPLIKIYEYFSRKYKECGQVFYYKYLQENWPSNEE